MSASGPNYYEFIPESAGVGASPGFTFGKNGQANSGTYLENEAVPSNLVGIPIGVTNGRISGVMFRCQDPTTVTIEIEEHDGNTFTSLGTFSITASRSQDFFGLNIVLTATKELAVKLQSGSSKSPKVVLLVKGDALA